MKSNSIFFRLSVVLIFISNAVFSLTCQLVSSRSSAIISYGPSKMFSIDPINFIGKCEGGKIVLKWNSIPETVNSYFVIEQSSNCVNWTIIGIVSGGVPSPTLLDYSFIDTKAHQGISYYRLRLAKANGDFNYTKIIDVTNCNEVLNKQDFIIYPNPSNGIFNLSFSGNENMLNSIEIFNATGNKIYDNGNFQSFVDLSGKPEGMYFIHFNLTTKSIIRKIKLQN